MPIYEYRCESCGRTVEKLEQMGADSSGYSCLNQLPEPELKALDYGLVLRVTFCWGKMLKTPSLPVLRPNGIAPSGSDAPALHNTGNRARRLWMNPDGTTKEQAEWRPAFDGDPGRQVG